MYTQHIIESSIKLYIHLKSISIIGLERIEIIQNTFNIHINTLYNWKNLYYNSDTLTFNFDNYSKNFKYNNVKITKEIEMFILSSINDKKQFNVKKIKKELLNKFKVDLSKSTIYYVLHKNNLTHKNIVVKNDKYTVDELKELKKQLNIKLDLVKENELLSYDEMAIYIDDEPKKGWSEKGKKCIIKTKRNSIVKKRYTIGMCINEDKTFIDYTINEKSLKSDKFNDFMEKINKKTKNKFTILMDNATIHKNTKFNKEIIKNKYKIIYNIPYQSELNPIEYVFSLLIRELLQNDNKDIESMIKTINNFMKNVQKKIYKTFLKKPNS